MQEDRDVHATALIIGKAREILSLTLNYIKNNFKIVVTGIVFLATYAPTWLWMWDRWFAKDSYYSHGILIPVVTGVLIWQKREELAKIKIESSRWGIPVIAFGLVCHILSSLFRIYFSSGFSMLIVFSGLILYFYGEKIFRKILFPICFLVFMFPVPLHTIAKVSFALKMLAAKLATISLNKMGMLAVQDGSWIKMQHAFVIVDDVCSGLRSLISLTALGAVFAYMMTVSMVKRITLFLSTIPIAIITNVVRIIFLASIAEIWGPKYAIGFTHDASGFLVFGLAFVLLFTVGRLLE